MSRTPVPRSPLSAQWLADHRWLYVVPALLPLSKAYALAEALSSRLLRRRSGAPRRHRQRVARMQARVREREPRGGGGLLCTARPQWRSMSPSRNESYKDGAFLVPAQLDDVLRVDTERGTVTVGPAVTMGRLTAALPRGWTLPVVPELEDLTVGGLFMGYGIETSSHRYGPVNRIGRWYKPWFHEHARARCRLRRNVEYVPLRDFHFRHSRSIYWAAEMLVPSGNHPLFRNALGWLMPPKAAFLKRTETPGIRRMYLRNTATQEALVPLGTLPEAIEKCREAFHVDRMWLCPVTLRRTEPYGAEGSFLDIYDKVSYN
ncbi:FAD-binding protein [Streptomyces klenkii]|uniref:FAD-binding protein n=1 Tax=Streptomyces klenkii TaxID=1420899 RepID=UPI0034391A95